jgi:phosphoribosylglycinamide formyltransferase-1
VEKLKIVIFTSNGIRHKFLANSLAKEVDDCLVVVESKPLDPLEIESNDESIELQEHFSQRTKTEQEFFKNNDFFVSKTLPILNKEVNSLYVSSTISKFNPDSIFVFGSSILKNEILNLVPSGRFFNLHLGISPYYRGSGTNFWPFVNNELEYVGATILHLDPGIDTGDIVAHVRPTFEKNDNVHTIGCKVIKNGISVLIKIIEQLKNDKKIQRIPQWKIPNEKVYRIKDFDGSALKLYKKNMKNQMIDSFIKSLKESPKLVNFEI